MPKGNEGYFGVALGQALAGGAGHISDALRRKYEMQRQAELDARQQRQLDIGTQASFAAKGIRYDPSQPLDPAIFDTLISEAQQRANLERRKTEAEIKRTEFQATPEGRYGGQKAPSGYRYTETGDLETIPGGPADKKTADKQGALTQVSNVLSEIRGHYLDLQQRGAIVDVEKGTVSNIFAKTQSSSLGQATGGVFGTEAQSVRQKILSSRPLLINFIRQASNMGARGLDSEKELEFYLSAATDPGKDIQSNLAAIERLDRAYGLSSMMAGGTPRAAGVSLPGLNPEESAELERLNKKFGGK